LSTKKSKKLHIAGKVTSKSHEWHIKRGSEEKPMTDEIREEFRQKERLLIDLCAQIANVLRQSKRQMDLNAAQTLEAASSALRTANHIEEKREIISTVKQVFHKEGVFDLGPSGVSWDDWRAMGDEIFGLVWIYQEAKYSERQN
jgi:hypothetical protein